MKKNRLLALLLCAVMLFTVVAACNKNDNSTQSTQSTPGGGESTPAGGGNSGESSSSGRDTLSMALRDDAGSLDAHTTTSQTYIAVQCILEPLWDVTEEGEIIMVLAESVDIVAPDEWIVHLRQGVTFSNGNPFTASDVYFSINLHASAGATGGPRVQTVDFDNMEVIDDNTFRLKLWDFHIANWTVLSMMLVYDEESYDPQRASLEPIGTGPYVLTEYVPNSHLSLTRNENYWGEPAAIKNLNFRILSEPSQVVNALQTGLIDIGPVATEDSEFVKNMPGFSVDSRYTGNYILMGFNFGVNSFFKDNVDARRAACHAVDPQVVVDMVYEGQGKVMKCVVPDICFDYELRFENMDDTYAIGYNVDLAKQLAESSGLAGQTISIMTDGTSQAITTAEIVQNMMGAIGVNVVINNYDPATVWGMLYDPTSVWDMSVGTGIAPNRRVGDMLVNGVRYSPTMSAPGAFENNEYYLQVAPLTLSTEDDAKRSEYLYEVLDMYIKNVLNFALCNVLYFNAFSTDIDPDSINYSVGIGAVRPQDLRFK